MLFNLFRRKPDPRITELSREMSEIELVQYEVLKRHDSQIKAQAEGLAELREELHSQAERIRRAELTAAGQGECRVCTRVLPVTSLVGNTCHQCSRVA